MTTAYQLPELPYATDALAPHLPAQIIELHHGTHHAGYVKKANAALDALAGARAAGDLANIVMLEKNLAFNLGGHVLHSIYWTNLSPDGGGKPPAGELMDAIGTSFGSYDGFRAEMTAATTSVQGSGWGALAWEPLGRRLVVEQIYDHQGNVAQGAEPLLVFDAWEHAFYLQYHSDKAAYVEGLWELVNWDDVARRFDAARSLQLAASA